MELRTSIVCNEEHVQLEPAYVFCIGDSERETKSTRSESLRALQGQNRQKKKLV
jgi:hypothetical protein